MNEQQDFISAGEVATCLEQGEGLTLVDVRTGVEYRAAHIQQARNLPLNRMSKGRLRDQLPQNGRIVFSCLTGKRAATACAMAKAQGIRDVYVLRNGLAGWRQAGLTVEEGKPGVSLERQVRIAAGFLVVLGTLLGVWVHPGWLGLACFVGFGLMFAGITNTCGMAMILARMPWNQ